MKAIDQLIGGSYIPDNEAEFLRVILTEDGQYLIDGATREGRHTEPCWDYDTFDDAVNDLREFAEEFTPHLLTPED